MARREQWYRVRLIEYYRGDAVGHPTGDQVTARVVGTSKRAVEKVYAKQGVVLGVERLGTMGPSDLHPHLPTGTRRG